MKGFKGNNVSWYGRTAVIPLANQGVSALKFLLPSGNPEELEKEAYLMNICTAKLKERFPKRRFPKVLPAEEGRLVYKFPEDLINKPEDLNVHPEKYAFCFLAPLDYFRYLGPPIDPDLQSIGYKERLEKIRGAALWTIEDLFTILVELGLWHTSLSPVSHHLGGQIRWDWYYNYPGGVGTIGLEEDSFKYSNIRLSGVADFEHFEPISFEYLGRPIGLMFSEWAMVIADTGRIYGLENKDIREILKEGYRTCLKVLGNDHPANIPQTLDQGLLSFVQEFKDLNRPYDYGLQEGLRALLSLTGFLVDQAETTPPFRVLNPVYIFFGAYGLGKGQFSSLEGITIDKEGHIYVADTHNHPIVVLRFDKGADEFRWLANFGALGSGKGQFYWPRGVAADEEGYIYVADTHNHRIVVLRFDKGADEFRWLASFGALGSGRDRFHQPRGIAVDREGYVYVADTYNHRIVVLRFDKEINEFKWLVNFGVLGPSPHKNQFCYPGCITPDKEGYVYVADTHNERIVILRFDKGADEFEWLASFGVLGSRKGQFHWPRRVITDEEGNLYVTDSGNRRIVRISLASQGRTMESPKGFDPFGHI